MNTFYQPTRKDLEMLGRTDYIVHAHMKSFEARHYNDFETTLIAMVFSFYKQTQQLEKMIKDHAMICPRPITVKLGEVKDE